MGSAPCFPPPPPTNPWLRETNGKPAAQTVVEPIDEQDFDHHIGRCSHVNHHRETAPRPPSGSSGTGAWGWESNGADIRAAYREAAARINSRRGVATHPMISAVAASGEDAEAGGRRRRAANPVQAIAIPAAIQPISP